MMGGSPETEDDRRRRVRELTAEEGPDWAERFQPGSFGCHELLDRVALISKILDDAVLSHPACLLNAGWYALADGASSALSELYQKVGAEHLGEGDGSQGPRLRDRRPEAGDRGE